MAEEQYGLTATGFNLKRLRTILDELKQKMSVVEDPDSGQNLEVNFDENDPFIQFLNIVCDELSAIWELLNAAYNQFDPMKANGAMLSSLVQLNGIRRKAGDPSTVLVVFSGTDDVTIPAGTLVTDANETVVWETTEEGVITDGSVTILCKSTVSGAFAVDAGEINTLVEPLTGVNSVINTKSSKVGSADESDIELRRRREKSTETPSQGLAESIYGSIEDLDGVTYCRVFTNRTLERDSNGIPPKSIAIVVQVEDKEDENLKKEIANNIFVRSGLGEEYYGLQDEPILPDYVTQRIDYVDSFNQVIPIFFIYPEEVPIYVEVHIKNLEASILPDDYVAQIKRNIVNFAEDGIQGLGIETESTATFDDFGFPPGEDVVVSRLYTPVNAVKGCKIVDIHIGNTPYPKTSEDIFISWYQVATFKEDNITVIWEGN